MNQNGEILEILPIFKIDQSQLKTNRSRSKLQRNKKINNITSFAADKSIKFNSWVNLQTIKTQHKHKHPSFGVKLLHTS